MVSPRRLLSSVAVGAAGVLLTAVLTGSASAAATDPPGCSNENAGAAGLTLPTCGSALLHGAVQVNLPGASVTVPSCPDATAALVQAHVIVGGLNGKGGTSKRLADAEADNAAAVKTLDRIAKKYYPIRDAATAAVANYDAVHAPNINKTVTPPVPYPAGSQAGRDALPESLALKDIGRKFFDATSAIYGPNGTKAVLEAARKAEGTAEQGVVDAEVVIGLACKDKPVPAPPVVAPAPVQQGQQVIIYPAVPGQPPTADSQTVTTHLPVTG